MQNHKINSLTSFDHCEVTKTLFLNKEHLSLDHQYKVRVQKIYKIKYNDIKMYIKRDVETYLNKGYKVVFEHNKTILLLIYNK